METLLLKIIEGQERTDRKLDGIQSSVERIEEKIAGMKSDIKELKDTTYRIEEHQEKTIESMLRHIKKKVDRKQSTN